MLLANLGHSFDADLHPTHSFYVHKNRAGPSDALILVPTKQFEQFLYNINEALDTNLTIPSGASGAFQVQFGIEGMPHPRYLGRSTSKDMADRMNLNTPPNTYRRNGEPKDITPTDRSLDAFRKKVNITPRAKAAKPHGNTKQIPRRSLCST